MREVASRAYTLGERVVYFYDELRPANEVVHDELPPGRNYTIFIDDFDRLYEQARPFVLVARSRNDDSVRLVLSSGEGTRSQVLRRLAEDGLVDAVGVQVPPLDDESTQALFEQHLTAVGPKQRQALARATGGNPLLIGLSIESIEAGRPPLSFVSNEQIRAHLVDRTIRAADSVLDPLSLDARELLSAVACLVPLRRDSDDSEVLRVWLGAPRDPKHNVGAAIEALRNAGVLRRVGRSYRFVPALIGDLLIAQRLSAPDGAQFRANVVDRALASQTERAATNLVHASQEVSVRNVVGETLELWAEQEQNRPTERRQSRLDAARMLAYVDPAGVLEFIRTLLAFPVPEGELCEGLSIEECSERVTQGEPVHHRLSLGQVCGPLEVVGRDAECIRGAMELLLLVRKLEPEPGFAGQIEQLIERWHSPATSSPEAITTGLETCRAWLRAGNPTKASLAIKGAVTVLGISWSYQTCAHGKFVFGAVVYDQHPRLLELRRKAVVILVEGIRHSRPGIRVQTCHAVRDVGKKAPLSSIAEPPLFPCAISERRELYGMFRERLKNERHLGVVHAIATSLLDSWLRERPCSNVAEEVLRRLNWTPELAAFSWAVDGEEGIDNLTDLMNAAPQTGRWPWWVDRGSQRALESTIPELVRRHSSLVEALTARHPSLDGFVSFLEKLACEGGFLTRARGHPTYGYPQDQLLGGSGKSGAVPAVLMRSAAIRDPDARPRRERGSRERSRR